MYCPRIAFRVLHEQRPCFDSVSCFLQYFYDVYRCLTSTQKQNRTLISDPKLLSFNSIQSRAVTGHLTGHHFLGRHFDTTVLTTIPCVEDVQQRRKPHLTFCLSVNPWRHSDIPIRAPFSGPRRCQKSKSGGNLELY